MCFRCHFCSNELLVFAVCTLHFCLCRHTVPHKLDKLIVVLKRRNHPAVFFDRGIAFSIGEELVASLALPVLHCTVCRAGRCSCVMVGQIVTECRKFFGLRLRGEVAGILRIREIRGISDRCAFRTGTGCLGFRLIVGRVDRHSDVRLIAVALMRQICSTGGIVVAPGITYPAVIVVLGTVVCLILLPDCCSEILIVAAGKEIIQKFIDRVRHISIICSIGILHIRDGVVNKRRIQNECRKVLVTADRIINRIHAITKLPHPPIHAPWVLRSITFAHIRAVNAGKVCIGQIRTVLEDAVNISNTTTICQTGKVNTGQFITALKGTAQMRIIVFLKLCARLHNNCFQIIEIHKQTVAV